MEYGSLTTGTPEWLKELEAQRKPFVINGITYVEKPGAHQCLIVKDYADLTSSAANFNELLCVSSDNSPVFIDLGNAPKGHDLIINAQDGKVYVNDLFFGCMIGLQSLGDGSWGVVFGDRPLQHSNVLARWLHKVYNLWLDKVYEKCSYLGMIEANSLHNRSVWHLIAPNLPKGKVISKEIQNNA